MHKFHSLSLSSSLPSLPLSPSLSPRGVLESLIKRHFPASSRVGMDWSLFDSDPTLPTNCRKRKQRGGPMFQDEEFSSDSDDSRLGGGSGVFLVEYLCVHGVC